MYSNPKCAKNGSCNDLLHPARLQHDYQPLQRGNMCIQAIETIYFFKFEIIINVLVNRFCFIWIPMLWAIRNMTGIDKRRQNLTSLYVRFWRIKLCSFVLNPANTKHCMTFVQPRANVFDVGSTLYTCHTNVLCLPDYYCVLTYILYIQLTCCDVACIQINWTMSQNGYK